MDKENIGDCREAQSELIQTHPTGEGTVGKQIKLLLFDAILHIAASTVGIFIPVIYLTFNISHCFSILSRQKPESPRKMMRT